MHRYLQGVHVSFTLQHSKVNENVSNVMTMNDIVDSAYH